jgi:hypothetical protein
MSATIHVHVYGSISYVSKHVPVFFYINEQFDIWEAKADLKEIFNIMTTSLFSSSLTYTTLKIENMAHSNVFDILE